MIYRQGDVLLKKILTIPKNVKKKDKILAWGEITNHHHKFTAKQALVFADKDGKQFCDLEQDCILEHEDHAHLTIPKGKYEVVIQREFDPLEGIRTVLD